MSPRRPYEVTLQEICIYAIDVDAIDAREAGELASDLYLHRGRTEPRIRALGTGHFEILEVCRIKTKESSGHASI